MSQTYNRLGLYDYYMSMFDVINTLTKTIKILNVNKRKIKNLNKVI